MALGTPVGLGLLAVVAGASVRTDSGTDVTGESLNGEEVTGRLIATGGVVGATGGADTGIRASSAVATAMLKYYRLDRPQ